MSSDTGLDYQDRQHRRYNILKDRWVLVCPHRMNRPWQGQQEQIDDPDRLLEQTAMTHNPLLPNTVRSSGHRNPQYKNTFIFDNDFPALIPERILDMTRSVSISSTPSDYTATRANLLQQLHQSNQGASSYSNNGIVGSFTGSATSYGPTLQVNGGGGGASYNGNNNNGIGSLKMASSRFTSMMFGSSGAASSRRGPINEIETREIDDDYDESYWYEKEIKPDSLLKVSQASGRCRVICYNPKPNSSFPLMRISEIKNVIQTWCDQQRELGRTHKWVQIFENRGSIMGSSNPHPHCQVWASDFFPNEPKIMNRNQLRYYRKFNSPLLMDYLNQELDSGDRIIKFNAHWVVLIPFWASWPFETMILPKRHLIRMQDMTDEEKRDLALILKSILTKYDNLFKCSFPYSMGWFGAPTGEYIDHDMSHWVVHCSFCPPLLRSARVKKFMVGYEMFAEEQRDLTPEKAADMLRDSSEIHYRL